ncbi:MAG: hypothetical protein ACM3JI_02250 [Anaerolineae bacterium]
MSQKKRKIALASLVLLGSSLQIQAEQSLQYSSLGSGSEIRENILSEGESPDTPSSRKVASESKCGDGSCGGDKKPNDGTCGKSKSKQAKCGKDKSKESKCSQGSCGDDKSKESKCGEGSCG